MPKLSLPLVASVEATPDEFNRFNLNTIHTTPLQSLGIVERALHPSTKISDKEKYSLSMTEKDLQFSKNLTDLTNSRQTQLIFTTVPMQEGARDE